MRVVSFWAVLVALAVAQGPPRRVAWTSNCGRQIAWETEFQAAAERARAENKPVLWFIPATAGTPMDRRQELYWYMMAGPFSDRRIVTLINSSFIPLKLTVGRVLRKFPESVPPERAEARELAKRYRLVPGQFIEPGFLILNPAMKRLHAFDRLVTFNGAWLADRMTEVMRHHQITVPELPQPPQDLRAAHAQLAAGAYAEALAAFTGAKPCAEAAYFRGVCLHRTRRTKAGDAVWKELVAQWPDDIFAEKAKLELKRRGPFLRGIESYRTFIAKAVRPSDKHTTTCVGSSSASAAVDAPLALEVLLSLQEEDGAWRDSWYDFGGLDSVPNVHVAVTALAATALLEWQNLLDTRGRNALADATAFLAREDRTNPEDNDEILWAHTYRLLFFARKIGLEPESKKDVLPVMQRIVGLLEKRQTNNGGWRHEYENAFATGHALWALARAREAGADVSEKVWKRGVRTLDGERGRDGAWGYSRGRRGSVEASAGRMPTCEMALFLHRASNDKRLTAAVEASFEHSGRLNAVRQYDNHADRLGYGGFFFWFDVHGRLEAARLCGKKKQRAAWLKRTHDEIRAIREADGGWIDSHELGKAYGTAMALICLARSTAK